MPIDPDGLPGEPSLVLIVEDEPLVRMLACDMLEVGGFESLEAGAASEALSLIATRPEIRVLFTDIDMPGDLDGLDLARTVAARAPKVKILVTSGAATPLPSDLPLGARFISKPYLPSKLLDLLKELLEPSLDV